MNNGVYRRIVYGPGIDEPIVFYRSDTTLSNGRRFLMADERGSIVSQAPNDGSASAIISYDEFGIPSSTPPAHGYTGQLWLPALGMWYYKARVYSPTLGRFLQTDPIGYGDGMNWYNYVGGDPVNFSDPSGLYSVCKDGTILDNNSPYACEDLGTTTEQIVAANEVPIGAYSGVQRYLRGPCIGTCEVDRIISIRMGQWQSDANLDADSGGGPLEGPIYIQSSPCNRMQQQLRQVGEFTVNVGGAGAAVGTVLTGGSTVLAAGGALTGNVPATGVGVLGITLGATVTTTSFQTQLVGSAIAFSGGASTQQLIRDGSDAYINRLPMPGPLRSGIRQGIDLASQHIPDIRVCR